ncbi:cytosine permease [Galbitalea sp. SE-J8]|uniref:cytosine permease n=1 Tax=Galbitalea sp. SE-J8 TaxID=3054952 RepID=UPI00259C9101|nr:cytosine permease [Galbitalea sp. SE-J8]MDM4761960.1 cytosine permease [Galbitalea sp. SE-J8]
MVPDEPREEGADDSVFDTGVYGLPSVRRASYTPPSAAQEPAPEPATPRSDPTDAATDGAEADGAETASPEAASPEAVSPEAVGPEAVSPEAVGPGAGAAEAATGPADVPVAPSPASGAPASTVPEFDDRPFDPGRLYGDGFAGGRAASDPSPPDAAGALPGPEDQAALLAEQAGPAGRPWVPQRSSLDDDALVDEVTHAIEEIDSLRAIEMLEAQLRLREEEAHEFVDWQQSMLAVGTPEALAAVEEVRPRFDDLVTSAISIVPPVAPPAAPTAPTDPGVPGAESDAYWSAPADAATDAAPAPWDPPAPAPAAPADAAPSDVPPTDVPPTDAVPTDAIPAEPAADVPADTVPPALVEPPPFPSAFSWATESGVGSEADAASAPSAVPASGPFADLPGGFSWATDVPGAAPAEAEAEADVEADAVSAARDAEEPAEQRDVWAPPWASVAEDTIDPYADLPSPVGSTDRPDVAPITFLEPSGPIVLPVVDDPVARFLAGEPSASVFAAPPAPEAAPPAPGAATEAAHASAPTGGVPTDGAPAASAPPTPSLLAGLPAPTGAPVIPADDPGDPFAGLSAPTGAPALVPDAVVESPGPAATDLAAELAAEFGAPEAAATPFRIEDVGVRPTPADERVGRAVRLFWLWFAPNASVVSVALGAVVFAMGVSLRQAVIAVLAGVVLSFLPLGLGTLAGRRSGQPTLVVSRATFGVRGNVLPAVVAVLSRVFWGGALLWLLGTSVADILIGAGLAEGLGHGQLVTLGIAVGFVVALLVAFVGYRLIRIVQLVIAIASAVLVVGVVALTWSYVDLATALVTPDGSILAAVGGAVLVFSVVGLLWVHASGDLARYQSGAGHGGPSMLAASLGAGIPVLVLAGYGALLAASDPAIAAGLTSDPLDTIGRMLPLWYPVPLVAAAALGLVSAVAVTVYSGSFAVAAAGLRLKQSVGTLLVALLVFALAFGLAAIGTDVTVLLRDLVTTVAVPVAAWAGMFATEVMLRTRRYDAPSLLATGGIYPAVRWGNLVAYVVVTAIGLGLVTATTTGLSWEGYGFALAGLPLDGELASADLGVVVALVLGVLAPLLVGRAGIRAQEAAGGGADPVAGPTVGEQPAR